MAISDESTPIQRFPLGHFLSKLTSMGIIPDSSDGRFLHIIADLHQENLRGLEFTSPDNDGFFEAFQQLVLGQDVYLRTRPAKHEVVTTHLILTKPTAHHKTLRFPDKFDLYLFSRADHERRDPHTTLAVEYYEGRELDIPTQTYDIKTRVRLVHRYMTSQGIQEADLWYGEHLDSMLFHVDRVRRYELTAQTA